MREIKFRAVYKGNLLDRVFKPFDLYDELTKPCNHDEAEYFRDGLVFEQFTGLKDKNCKEIYEGDICRIVRYNGELQTVGDIFFDKGAFRITNGYAVADTDSLGRFKADIVEVIGNIHEHSHLLK